MFITAVDEDTRPVHRQIRDQVLEEIARGRANEGDRLPSARSLASSLGVNFQTVEKAHPALEADGVVIGDRQRRLLILLPLTATLEFSLDWERRQRLLLADPASTRPCQRGDPPEATPLSG